MSYCTAGDKPLQCKKCKLRCRFCLHEKTLCPKPPSSQTPVTLPGLVLVSALLVLDSALLVLVRALLVPVSASKVTQIGNVCFPFLLQQF